MIYVKGGEIRETSYEIEGVSIVLKCFKMLLLFVENKVFETINISFCSDEHIYTALMLCWNGLVRFEHDCNGRGSKWTLGRSGRD